MANYYKQGYTFNPNAALGASPSLWHLPCSVWIAESKVRSTQYFSSFQSKVLLY